MSGEGEDITVEGDDTVVVEEAPTVVTVVESDDGGSDDVSMVDLVHEQRITQLEGAMGEVFTRLDALDSRTAVAEIVDEIQQEQIDAIGETVVEEVVEGATEPEPDNPPESKLHRWWGKAT